MRDGDRLSIGVHELVYHDRRTKQDKAVDPDDDTEIDELDDEEAEDADSDDAAVN